jgi:hypothetical protein
MSYLLQLLEMLAGFNYSKYYNERIINYTSIYKYILANIYVTVGYIIC